MGTLRFLFVTVLALAFALTPSVKANERSFTEGASRMNPMTESADSVLGLGHTTPEFAWSDKRQLAIGSKVDFIGPAAVQDKSNPDNSDDAVLSSVATTPNSKSIGRIFLPDRNAPILRYTDGRINGVVSMPEPATLLLLGSGLTGIGARSWLKRRARKR
jgi:hypothetical protein